MSSRNYTATFSVDQTPSEVFKAVTNVRGWWSEAIEGGTEKLGDVFTFQHEDIHRSTQRLVEVVQDEKVAWLVLDAYLSFTEDTTEWKGTTIIFEISRKGSKTELRFTHRGLTPARECYRDCASAWDFYVRESLRSLITTGKGQPIRREDAVEADARAERRGR